MMSLIVKKLLSLLTGELFDSVTDIWKKYLDKEITKAELQVQLFGLLVPAFTKTIEAQKDVLIAEIKSEDWLVRRWRPMVVIALATIPIFYGLVTPVAVAWFGMEPVRVGDALLLEILAIVKVAIGGYIGSRGLEKIATTVSNAIRK